MNTVGCYVLKHVCAQTCMCHTQHTHTHTHTHTHNIYITTTTTTTTTITSMSLYDVQGCSFGYFVGGWGKPPVDELGRPLYGDVFGVDHGTPGAMGDEYVDETVWGELESEEEEEEEEEEEVQ